MTAAISSRAASFRPSWIRIGGFLVVCAVAIGLAGPFGMTVSQPDPLARIAHFLVCAIGMTLLTIGAAGGLSRLRPQLGVWALAIGAALVALPGAALVRVSLGVFAPVSMAHLTLINLLIETLAMNLILTLVAWRLLGGGIEERRATEAVKSAGPGLAHHLPPELRSAPVLALKAEDHYLRVYTTRGEALIHMRIGDAEAALAENDGVRAHRSFWVARRAFKSVARVDGRMTLRLESGLFVPVSRSRTEAVNSWLERAVG